LRKILKLPEDEKMNKELRTAFYKNYKIMEKTWTRENYRLKFIKSKDLFIIIKLVKSKLSAFYEGSL